MSPASATEAAREAGRSLAHRVLLPAIAGLDFSEVDPLIRRGCRSVLLGETRGEYVARRMSDARVEAETRELVAAATSRLAAAADGPLLVAVDHELGGIRRFDHLLHEGTLATADEVRGSLADDGAALGEIGVNMVLGPILDVVRGTNPWLSGRNLGGDAARVSALGAAAIEGLQAAGVVAIAKHYPGHASVALDPAERREARLTTAAAELESIDEMPFRAAVASGVRGLMLGPVPVDALDGSASASLSPVIATRARDRLGFEGVLLTDDIDAPATRGSLDVPAAAVQALIAGADMLLVAASNARDCADAIYRATVDGVLRFERLADAARRVEGLAAAAIHISP
jgi:beta-N-acetylhexosaminidase